MDAAELSPDSCWAVKRELNIICCYNWLLFYIIRDQTELFPQYVRGFSV